MLHLAQSGTFDALKNTFYTGVLEQLTKYDTEYGTRLIQVLYAYLTSERRATTAGRTLHMHRNSVLYHITRIEDLAGISLDDYWTRLKLLLAFHFMELKASNRALTLNGDTAGD